MLRSGTSIMTGSPKPVLIPAFLLTHLDRLYPPLVVSSLHQVVSSAEQNVLLASKLRDQDVSYSGYQPTWDGKSVSPHRLSGVNLTGQTSAQARGRRAAFDLNGKRRASTW